MSQGLAFLMGALGLGLWKAPAPAGEALKHEPVVHAGLQGWVELLGGAQNVLVWAIGVVVLCLVALVSRPSETSFKTYLTELSFRKHLRDLHRPSGSTEARTSSVSTSSNGVPSTPHARRQDHSEDSSHTSDHPTPFRFSNHVAITMRTPGYTYKSIWLFALVWIAPQPGHAVGSPSGHKKTSLIVGKGGNKHARRIVSGSGADDDMDSWECATLAGVWYFGALGQWFAMGSLPGTPGSIGNKSLVAVIIACGWYLARMGIKLFNRLTDRDGKSRGGEETRVGDKTHAGVLNIVSLPDVKDDVAPEAVTRLLDDSTAHRLASPLKNSIAPASNRDDHPTSLGQNASLPLHVKPEGLLQSAQSVPVRPALAVLGSSDAHDTDSAAATRQEHAALNGTVDNKVDQPESLTTKSVADHTTASARPAPQTPSPAVGELTTNLQNAQTAVADLREQLDSLNANVEQSQQQLNASLEDLRRKKKDEDSDRADVKARMKVLEENKRQAEGAKREAEKKLRSAESTRDAIRNRIDSMRQEASDMDKERVGCLDAVKESKETREEHARETARKLASSAEELETIEGQVTEEGKANAELAEKVLRAVEVLQSLIDKSPQAMEEPAFQSDGNVSTPKENSDPTTPDFSRQHQHPGSDFGYSGNMYGSIAQNHHDRLPPFQLAFPPSRLAHREVSGETISGRYNQGQGSGAFPFSRVPSFKDLTGYEGFGPMAGPPAMDRSYAGPAQAQYEHDTLQTLTQDDVEEPSSPTGTMSSSFTANLHLLPQGLFRSLEGDATPVEDRDMGLSDYDIDEVLGAPEEDLGSLLDQPSVPAIRRDSPEDHTTPPATSNGKDGDEEPAASPHLLEAQTHAHGQLVLDPYGQAHGEGLSSSPSRVSPRRWFSKVKTGSSGNTQVDALTDPAKHHPTGAAALLGRPLSLTLSNDSLIGSGQAFENAFAPSAAEKRALRWGSIGRWASNRQPGQGEYSSAGMAPGSSANGFVRTPPDSARSSSVDLTARSAWDHAVPAAGSGGPSDGEKNAFRFFSLGKKLADK